MKLSLTQTKLIGLTMELELKTHEYKTLCEKLEQMKSSDNNSNTPAFFNLLEKFKKNNEEIVELNKQLKALENEGKK